MRVLVLLFLWGIGVVLGLQAQEVADPKSIAFQSDGMAPPEKIAPPPSSLKGGKKPAAKAVYHIPAAPAEKPAAVISLKPATQPIAKEGLLEMEGLLLAKGYQLQTISFPGEPTLDGFRVPSGAAGLAVANGQGRDELLLLSAYGLTGVDCAQAAIFPEDIAAGYVMEDFIYQHTPLAAGGVGRAVYNAHSRHVTRQDMALAGLARPMAVCATPWGSFLAAEASDDPAFEGAPEHGYLFEVPVTTRGLVPPKPLKALGRREHAGVAVDSQSGVVYMAEAPSVGGFGLLYRFKSRAWGELSEGSLEVLAFVGDPRADTRNLAMARMGVGRAYDVFWVTITDGGVANDRPARQTLERFERHGAAAFAPVAAMTYAEGKIYFITTAGGAQSKGQLFELHGNRLRLLEEFGDTTGPLYPLSLAVGGDTLYIGEGGKQVEINNRLLKRPLAGGAWEVVASARATPNSATIPEGFSGLAYDKPSDTLFLNLRASGRTLALFKGTLEP